jgi:hypothetical protein
MQDFGGRKTGKNVGLGHIQIDLKEYAGSTWNELVFLMRGSYCALL